MRIRTLFLSTVAPSLLMAQQAAFDRNIVPKLPASARLVLPTVTQSRLANGVPVQLVTQTEVPLVQVTLTIDGGSRLDQVSPGRASFTTRMLLEGAGSRDANALQSELAFLGANLSANASWDSFIISLNVPKRSLGAALDLMADLVQRPTFKSADVRRQRDLRAAAILQRRDQAGAVASLAFNSIVFPKAHPYHAPGDGDSATTAKLDSASVRAFYQTAFVPDRAKFVVAGDITDAEVQTALGSRFGNWISSGTGVTMPTVTARAVANAGNRVFLIDKPGAAQSVLAIGGPGVARSSPDYAALVVMNTLLGASFSSRLNTNLRETKGYTYGASSRFNWLPTPGAFQIGTQVRTDVTDSSLIEVFKELRAIRDAPASAVEIARSKAYVALSIPGDFETVGQIAAQLVDVNQFGMPLSSVSDFIARVNAVTAADVQRVARKYLPLNRATIVVVGDLLKIRPGIEALKLGPVTTLDAATVAK
jgi:zinc protease